MGWSAGLHCGEAGGLGDDVRAQGGGDSTVRSSPGTVPTLGAQCGGGGRVRLKQSSGSVRPCSCFILRDLRSHLSVRSRGVTVSDVSVGGVTDKLVGITPNPKPPSVHARVTFNAAHRSSHNLCCLSK